MPTMRLRDALANLDHEITGNTVKRTVQDRVIEPASGRCRRDRDTKEI